MPEFSPLDLWPMHWSRPWALWGLLLAAALPFLGRRADGGAVPSGVIDSRLLPHLLVRGGAGGWLRPADTLALALACFCLGLAGPAWQREPAPLAMEEAPLMLALDLSEAMDAADLPPSRLDRARDKLRRLIERRGNAPTGLLVYAGSAHLVLPPTQDHQVLGSYMDALSTGLMPRAGNAPARALDLALQWVERSAVPGTVLFVTADWPAKELEATASLLAGSRHRLLVWALGTPEGGPLRDEQGGLLTDAQGRSRSARLDVEGLSALRDRTGAALVSHSQGDADVQRVLAQIASHRADAMEQDPTRRWLDRGPLFIWPGLLALLLSLRRGWVLQWHAAFLLTLALLLGSAPAPVWAQGSDDARPAWMQGVLGWWLTPDQQGRWLLERGQPALAAQRFADPFWRGLAHARAGQWQEAAQAFARVDSAAAWFNQAQMLARLGRYADAVAAYDQALLRLPGWPEALTDRERVRGLIPPEPKDEAADGDLQAGEAEGREAGQRRARKAGPPRRLTEAELAKLWLQRLDTSPAGFLQRKFEAQLREPGERSSRDGGQR